MAATLGTITTFEVSSGNIAAILKEFYVSAVQEQLNNEVLATQLFEKESVGWSGRSLIVPLHTGRNGGVGYSSDGGTIPGAGNQSYNRYIVEARFLFGRFQITGPAISAAKKQGPGAFLNALDIEMKALVDDVRNQANKDFFTGGRVVGFLNQNSASSVAESDTANTFWEFTGNDSKVKKWLSDKGGNVDVNLVAMDDYDTLANANTSYNSTCQISASVNGSILQLSPGVDTTVLTASYATAIQLTDTANNLSSSLSEEPSGIFDNLARNPLFNVNREASGSHGALRSVVKTVAVSGDQDRTSLTQGSMQNVLDEIHERSGKEPDVILMHPVMRQEYQAIASTNSTNFRVNVRDGGKASQDLDVGFSDLSYNGVPIKVDRHCPKGCVIFLSTDTWKLAELEEGGFAVGDGSPLNRLTNSDAYDGYYRWYYNLVCVKPNANGILVGASFSTSQSTTDGSNPNA